MPSSSHRGGSNRGKGEREASAKPKIVDITWEEQKRDKKEGNRPKEADAHGSDSAGLNAPQQQPNKEQDEDEETDSNPAWPWGPQGRPSDRGGSTGVAHNVPTQRRETHQDTGADATEANLAGQTGYGGYGHRSRNMRLRNKWGTSTILVGRLAFFSCCTDGQACRASAQPEGTQVCNRRHPTRQSNL